MRSVALPHLESLGATGCLSVPFERLDISHRCLKCLRQNADGRSDGDAHVKTNYSQLDGELPEVRIANALRALANRADPNSLRSIERAQESSARVCLQTVANVMSGKSSARSLHNVSTVTDSILSAIADLEDPERGRLREEVLAIHAGAMAPRPPAAEPPTRSDKTAQHFLNVAFDWASALPRGPRDAEEVIATIAMRGADGPRFRPEVFHDGTDREIQWEVLEGSLARKHGQAGWTDYRDDGPTWHGLWGPVGDDDTKPTWFLAVYLDALGAASVYVRATTPDSTDLIAHAALAAAFDVVNVLGWAGDAEILAQSVGPSREVKKNRDYTRRSGGWRTWIAASFVVPPRSVYPLGNRFAMHLVYGLARDDPEYEIKANEFSTRVGEFMTRPQESRKARRR